MTNGEVLWAAVRDNPFDELSKLMLSDWLEEQGDEPRYREDIAELRAGRIPLTTEQDYDAITALMKATLSRFDKRFISDAHRLFSRCQGVTPRQFLWLWVLARRYRRQITLPTVLERAEQRYARYCHLLDLVWRAPAQRHLTAKNFKVEMSACTLFDNLMCDNMDFGVKQ